MNLKRITATLAVTATVAGAFGAMARSDADAAPAVVREQIVAGPTNLEARASLPRTLAGFQRAFDRLPAHQWGGGDIGVTTVLRDGRAVWFMGDTRTHRQGHLWLNRNTALVQTGEVLRPANDGAQVLPASSRYVYWPVKVAEVAPGELLVWTSKVHVWQGGAWAFKRVRPSETRVARVHVDDAGDMRFGGWAGWTATPTGEGTTPPDGSDARPLEYGHWAYQRIEHPDLPLAGGAVLVTESQNWDDGHKRDTDYRLLLSSSR